MAGSRSLRVPFLGTSGPRDGRGGDCRTGSGLIGDYLNANGNSTVTLAGGAILGAAAAFGNSALRMTGGSLGGYLAGNHRSTIQVSGGTIGDLLFALDGSTVTVSGCSLLLANPTRVNNGTRFTLTGVLQDGTVFQKSATATDQGAFQLKPVENPLPVILCPPARIVSSAGRTAVPVPLDLPQVTGNCLAITTTGTRSDNLPLSAPYPVGTTLITWQATDTNGNAATCAQMITVQ